MPPLPLTCCTEFGSRACPWSPRNTCMSLPRNLGFVRISHVSDETCGEEFGLPTMNPAGVEHLEPATERRLCHARDNPDCSRRSVPRCRMRRALRLLCVRVRECLLPTGMQQASQELTKRDLRTDLMCRVTCASNADEQRPTRNPARIQGQTALNQTCRIAHPMCRRSGHRRCAPAPRHAKGYG